MREDKRPAKRLLTANVVMALADCVWLVITIRTPKTDSFVPACIMVFCSFGIYTSTLLLKKGDKKP